MNDFERVHYLDEDGVEPICRIAVEGDGVWPFFDAQITCDRCVDILDQSGMARR